VPDGPKRRRSFGRRSHIKGKGRVIRGEELRENGGTIGWKKGFSVKLDITGDIIRSLRLSLKAFC
jgi:hypothetical protein